MPASTPVSEVMTRDVVTLRPDQRIEEAADILAEKQIGAAPVVDESGKTKRIRFNYNRAVANGGDEENVVLRSGDVVVVP